MYVICAQQPRKKVGKQTVIKGSITVPAICHLLPVGRHSRYYLIISFFEDAHKGVQRVKMLKTGSCLAGKFATTIVHVVCDLFKRAPELLFPLLLLHCTVLITLVTGEILSYIYIYDTYKAKILLV